MSGLRSSRNLLAAPLVIRMVLAVKHLQMTKVIIFDNFYCKIFSKKNIPWACPGSGPPGSCWRLPRWSGWSWLSGNTFRLPISSYLTTLVSKTFSKNQSLGMSWLRSSRNLLAAPMVIRMVLDVWKHLKTTHLINQNSFCFINCLKKSIPGDDRAQVLQEPVGASLGDQGRKFAKVSYQVLILGSRAFQWYLIRGCTQLGLLITPLRMPNLI